MSIWAVPSSADTCTLPVVLSIPNTICEAKKDSWKQSRVRQVQKGQREMLLWYFFSDFPCQVFVASLFSSRSGFMIFVSLFLILCGILVRFHFIEDELQSSMIMTYSNNDREFIGNITRLICFCPLVYTVL